MERDGLDILREKERGEEAQYFRRKDQELLQKLREKAQLDELANMLGQKLQVDDPVLLKRIVADGVTLETGAAFLLAPLVQIAWAEGKVSPEERAMILKIARDAYRAIGAEGFARIDFLLRGDDLFLSEINTIPGFTPISLFPTMPSTGGYSFADVCEKVVGLAIERHEARAGNALEPGDLPR